MKRIFTFTLLLLFILTPILSTWSHTDHRDNWEIRDELRRQRLENQETRWRQDEQREIQPPTGRTKRDVRTIRLTESINGNATYHSQ